MTTNTNEKPLVSEQSAILVGVLLSGEDSARLTEDLDELEALLKTLQVQVKGRIIQRRQKLTPKCLLGTGKVEEIKQLADEYDATMVVFDRPLSPPQVTNLEEMTKKKIFDRTGVIIEIFAKHARTTQAKAQVELARLQYMMPRMAGAWTHFQRQSGGGINRGMGEKQIEIDRRRARDKMARLRVQLDQIQKEKATQRKARSNELKVVLVGYTNSGKTTLMKSLTKAQVEARDELFATLDTKVKTIDPKTRPRILLSDTVGFIRNLPHSLVESFKTTLEEVREADLLLHVVDVSHPAYEEHMATTQKVLSEIGAENVPQIIVFNKVDQLDDKLLAKVLKRVHRRSVVLSAQSLADVLDLRDHVYEFFKEYLVEMTVAVPVHDRTIQSLIYNTSLILAQDYAESGEMIFHIQTARSTVERLRPYIINPSMDREEVLYDSRCFG